MTIQTCKDQYDAAAKRGDKAEMAFWKDRAIKKSSKPKYANIDIKELFGEEEVKEEEPKTKSKKGK